MTTLRIKNVGPIVDSSQLNVTHLTLFIGKQSTGKSTLMKILCYCSWFEKHLMVGDDKFLYDYTHYQRFFRELKRFHRLSDDEFSSNSLIEYESDAIQLELVGNKRNVKVIKKSEFRTQQQNLKLCFVPAERNFISSIQNIEKVYRTSDIDNLFNFIYEWRMAKTMFTSDKSLDVVVTKGMKFYYDKKADKEILQLSNSKRITPYYASSGVQSALPILVAANYLHSLIGQANYSVSNYAENKSLDKFVYKYFKLFIEEPEQNLFPESQYELLLSLVKLLKASPSYIVITSHSPYILTTINILIEASAAFSKDKQQTAKFVDANLCLPSSAFSAYYLTEDGYVENMIDEETSLVKGEYLDSVSETIDEMTYNLNKIIYGDD